MATVATTTSIGKVGKKSGLILKTLQRCKSGLSAAAGGSSGRSPPGCFSVYVGPERERFVVRAECANHPLFRRLLDDAEREYGYAAQGPLALPGCDVDSFLDVLWQMERTDADEEVAAASSSICGLHNGSKGRAARYRMLSPRPSPMVGPWQAGDQVRACRKERKEKIKGTFGFDVFKAGTDPDRSSMHELR